jgi:hypothetical protein
MPGATEQPTDGCKTSYDEQAGHRGAKTIGQQAAQPDGNRPPLRVANRHDSSSTTH